jgi:hypothetical protein
MPNLLRCRRTDTQDRSKAKPELKFFTTTIPKHASCAVSGGCPNPWRALFPILSERATRSRAASAFASFQSVEFGELRRVSYPQGGHFIFFPPMRIAARNECPAPDPAKAGHLGRRSA